MIARLRSGGGALPSCSRRSRTWISRPKLWLPCLRPARFAKRPRPPSEKRKRPWRSSRKMPERTSPASPAKRFVPYFRIPRS